MEYKLKTLESTILELTIIMEQNILYSYLG